MSSLGQMLRTQLRGEVPSGEAPFVRDAEVPVAIVRDSASRHLHSPRAFQVAAFLGGALAAALLFARNYYVLGRRRAASITLLIGFPIDVALLAFALAQNNVWGLMLLFGGRQVMLGIAAGELAVLFRKDYDAGIHWVASAWWVVIAIAIADVVGTALWLALLPLVL